MLRVHFGCKCRWHGILLQQLPIAFRLGLAVVDNYLGLFNLLRGVMGEPIMPKIISTVVAATAAFVGNRFWTWRDRERSGLRREYLLYFSVNLVGLLISVGCLWISHNWLGTYWPVLTSQLADNISGNIIGKTLTAEESNTSPERGVQ